MAHIYRAQAWKEELWNVSLLPNVEVAPSTVEVAPSSAKPSHSGPRRSDDQALSAPAVLFVFEQAPPPPLANAA